MNGAEAINERHSLRTRDESPREPGIKRQSETG